MEAYSYKQNSKNSIRHTIFTHAVNYLTVERAHACCVSRTYARNIADYFLCLDESEPVRKEAQKIQSNYFSAWESLHDSIIGYKRPSDLVVCYLSGPQPQNDFDEIIALGVLPQNIWAFENDQATYLEALNVYNSPAFPQPRIVKMSVEQFFKQSPKKFDLVYIDACGAIPSKQRALRCVTTLFYHQRLNSPGVLITNFAKPDISDNIQSEYAAMIALYLVFKENPNAEVHIINDEFDIDGMKTLYQEVVNSFECYYGSFISLILSDIASIIVPLQRFGEMAPYSNLFEAQQITGSSFPTTLEEINDIKYNSVCKWLLTLDFLSNTLPQSPFYSRSRPLCIEILGLEGKWEQLIKGVKYFTRLKNNTIHIAPEMAEIKGFFDSAQNLYQFLDRPTIALFYDVVINQLTYPYHSNTEFCKSYHYCAKKTDMFTDLTVYDECRYLYEWLPAIHQIKNAMQNESWQYVFRFALDGLVKQRLNYNNEFFFQGSVISKNEIGFVAKERKSRETIGG